MTADRVQSLTLESLGDRVPVITEEAVGFYKDNCMVCFENQGHTSGVRLEARWGDSCRVFEFHWSGQMTERLSRYYGALRRATENAACAIALLLVAELTRFTAVEQSSIGTTIDYYLACQDDLGGEDLIFNHTARLEVSGILKESAANTVDHRIREKLRRLNPEGDLPTLIAVVEFSRPWSRMVEA